MVIQDPSLVEKGRIGVERCDIQAEESREI